MFQFCNHPFLKLMKDLLQFKLKMLIIGSFRVYRDKGVKRSANEMNEYCGSLAIMLKQVTSSKVEISFRSLEILSNNSPQVKNLSVTDKHGNGNNHSTCN